MAGIDAIRMLKDDHKTVEQLFKRFEKAGDRAHVEKRDIVDRIIEALSVHASIEEQLFYPVARATVPGTEAIALESLEEHHIVKWVLSELDSMTPEDERFDAKVTVLIENVRHHVEEEEQEFFPMVRGQLGRNALGELGEAMATAKKTAPTHPHPRSPDSPPANQVMAPAAGVADRIGDTMSGLAQGYVTAVGDIVALVLGRKKPQASPTGSKVTRTAAVRVRSGASNAVDTARTGTATSTKRTAAAKRAGTTTARTARTARPARTARAATKTTTTAKRSAAAR
jgi:hemerythrin superfamily protein